MVFNNVYIYHKNQQFEFDIDQKTKYKSIFKTQKSKGGSIPKTDKVFQIIP